MPWLSPSLRVGFYAALVLSAVLHGVVEPWSALLFQWLTLGLGLGWVFGIYQRRQLTLFIPPLFWPLAGLLVLGLAQSVTWIDAAGLRQSLSFDVEATRRTCLMLTCLLLMVLLAGNLFKEKEDWQGLLRFLPIFGLVLALLAILQHFTMRNHILWLREITTNSPFGTFINRDHFAGYMELLIGFPLAVIVTQQVRGEGRFLYVVAAMLMGLALVLTLSRGGILSLLVELICIAGLAQRRTVYLREQRLRGRQAGASWLGVVTVGGVLAAILAGILWIGAEPVLNRLVTGSSESSDLSKAQTLEQARGSIWRDTWLLIKAKPWLGTGLGAFETAFPQFGLDDNESGGMLAQAHNDYLQVLADGGLLGGLLLLGFLYVVLRSILDSVKVQDPSLAALAIGSAGGVLGILVHSFFDFNLQLVSHALLFLLLGTVLARLQAQRAALPVRDAQATFVPASVTASPEVSEVLSS